MFSLQLSLVSVADNSHFCLFHINPYAKHKIHNILIYIEALIVYLIFIYSYLFTAGFIIVYVTHPNHSARQQLIAPFSIGDAGPDISG